MGHGSHLSRDLTVYIASLPRSGSTLVERLLASHPDVAGLGELSRLRQPLRDEATWCGCGHVVSECPFWLRITTRLSVEGAVTPTRLKKSLPIAAAVASAPIRFRRPILALLKLLPAGRHNAAVIRNLEEIRSAVRQITGKSVLVDSSKYALNFKYYSLASPHEFRTLLLVRDGRGVMYSLMRRGMTAEAAAKAWVKSVKRARLMAALLPRWTVMRIHYEDVCNSTAEELSRVYNFLGLQPVVPGVSTGSQHSIGGSPSFGNSDSTTTIQVKLDESWVTGLSRNDLRRFERIGGRLNRSLGYPD